MIAMDAALISDLIGHAPAGINLAALALFTRAGRDKPVSDVPDFTILENTPSAFFLTDALGVVVEHNEAARALATSIGSRITGGAKMRTLLGNDSGADSAIYRAMRRAANEGNTFEVFGVTMAGIPSDAHVEITRQENPRYFLWSIAITRKVQEIEEQSALPFDMSDAPIACFNADTEGRILDMNPVMRQLVGLDAEVPEGEHITVNDLFGGHGDDLMMPVAEGTDTLEKRGMLLTRSGEREPVRVIQKIRGGDVAGGLIQAFVIPSRRRSLSEAGDDVRRLVRLLDDAPVAVAVTDFDGLVLEANDRLASMSGGAARVGAEISLAVRLDDRDDVNQRLKAVANGAAPRSPLDIKLTGEARKEHEAQFHAHRIDTDKGEMLLAYVMDVSAQKVVERKLAQADKMQSVGQLAGGIAHDVNNVLTAIRGHCDLLMLRHHEGDPDFDHLYQIQGQTVRAAATISHLLAFSRRQTMRRQITQLSETLDEMRFLLKPYITERITFRSHHARDLGLVRIDRNEFHRVIMNLAVNACDAMQGGGTLMVTTRNVEPEEVAEFGYEPIPKGNWVMTEMTDTGTGISKADQESIFEPFFTTKPTGKGTGLGLSTVYGIIKQMEGFIYCESELGKGTTFRIFLPRYLGPVEAEADTTKKDAITPRDLSGTGRVLLVEDEDSVRSFAAKALELRGYTVTAAASGQEAIDVVMENPEAIDLVVSDVVMPEMTGPEMMRVVRKLRPEIQFIFISGYAEDAFREEMMDDEQFHFLAKPFSLKDLAVKVKKAFQS